MSALRGIVLGGLGLTMLEVVVTSRTATDNATTLANLAASAINRIVDPAVPLIPDRRN